MNIWTKLAAFSIYETERLLLRPVFYTDSEAFYDIASDPENLDFIFPVQASLEESQFALANFFMKEPLGIWAITPKPSDRMIGCIKFEKLDVIKKEGELGYFIHKDYRGRGLVTEAVKNLSDLSFREFGLTRLKIVTHLENLSSQRVAEKSGYRLSRQFKGSDRYSRKMRDYKEFRLSQGDFYE